MAEKITLTRREFGIGAMAMAVTVTLTSCVGGGGDATQIAAEGKKSKRGYIEPPFLADRVKSGDLPPIDERLPADVFMVGAGVLMQKSNESWRDGRYGGTIKNSPTFPTGNMNIGTGASVLRSPSQQTDVSTPNIVSKFSHNADYTSFEFTIRDGLKWSDGQPLTTDDVKFLFEDLYGDPDANSPFPTDLYTQRNSDGQTAKLSIADKQTFTLAFDKPYGQFIAALNSWIPTSSMLFVPSHYLKQFHKKYAKPDELAAAIKKANVQTWQQLMAAKNLQSWSCGEADALGLPVLNAWVLTKVDETSRTFERNPYFWHVDHSGHQLPYADQVVNSIVVDDDALQTAIMDGQVSVASGDNVTLNKMPVYKQSTSHAGTRVFTTNSFNNPPLLFLNHDFNWDKPNDPWQKLISDPDHRFGKAIAASIDANKINKSVYFGLHGKPMLNSKNHDPALSKKLLDEVGMDKTDSGGFRLYPDGSPFTLAITFPTTSAPDFAPVAELLKEQIGAVGIRVTVKGIQGDLFSQQANANQIMASVHWNDGPGWASGISNDYFPADKGPWSPATWAYVKSHGKSGRKPPQYIQEFYDIASSRAEFAPASKEGKAAYQKLIDWLTGNYAFIPTTGLRVKPNVVKTNVRNVPKQGAPFELDTVINLEGVWFDA
jgi:peptide/nickel transport system substrate-binding protein